MALNSAQERSVRKLADQYGIPQDFALGITDKESAGRAFWDVAGMLRPAIRPEVHKFYAFLSGAKRDAAVRMGLASKARNGVRLPTTYSGLYTFLEKMRSIDDTAALKSISMGIGQVMGFNYAICGYATVQQMWEDAQNGFEGQARMMFAFIANNSTLKNAAKNYNYPVFAAGYNGTAYKENNYDVELRQFVNRWKSKAISTPVPVDTYAVKIEGLGYKTVEEFQRSFGLKVDGLIGPMTRAQVDKVMQSVKTEINRPVENNKIVVQSSAGALGVAAISEVVKSNTDLVKPLLDTVQTAASYGTNVILIVASVCLVAYGVNWYLKRQKANKELRKVDPIAVN